MQLSIQQRNALSESINRELNVQEMLSQAREAAAKRITEYFESRSSDDDTRCPDRIRVAIQFTARAFQPLQVLLRAAARNAASDDGGSTAADVSGFMGQSATPAESQHEMAERGPKFHESKSKRKARIRAESSDRYRR